MSESIIDILDFLRSQGIDAKPKGDEIHFCCPFHHESDPSFAVNVNWPHLYNCLACHATGNIYSLVKHMTGMSFREVFGDVTSELTNFYWKQPPKEVTYTEEQTTPEIKKSGDFHSIQSDIDAWDYMVGVRGVSPKFIKQFGLYATGRAYINSSEVSNRVLIDCYLDGQLRNIECRDFTGKAERKVKYPYGLKSDFLFNIDNIDPEQDVVFLEGIMDLAKVWSVYPNAVSCFGNSPAKRPLQQEAAKRFGRKCVFMFDNDNGGWSALQEMYNCMESEFAIAFLPDGVKDPGEATLQQIEESLQNKVYVTDWLYSQRQPKRLTW